MPAIHERIARNSLGPAIYTIVVKWEESNREEDSEVYLLGADTVRVSTETQERQEVDSRDAHCIAPCTTRRWPLHSEYLQRNQQDT
jgi:hypothetical protein